MRTILGAVGIFFATVLFLSIEIKQKPIFGHIYGLISPATRGAQRATENFFGSSYEKTHRYSKRLFENSVPNGDTVRSKMSASAKRNVGEPAEKIYEEEKEKLDDLIKSHR